MRDGDRYIERECEYFGHGCGMRHSLVLISSFIGDTHILGEQGETFG